MRTVDSDIASRSDLHHGRADADNGEPTVQAPTAEIRHLLARTRIAIAWGEANLDSDMQPKTGGALYPIDAFIRCLVDHHHLSAHPGESDLSLTLRALGTEFGQIAHHAKEAAQAMQKTADRIPHPRT